MAVSRRLRYEILRRDNHQCRYCGAAAPDAKLTVDHVVPVALGGSDDPSNLVTACGPCNGGKSASSPDAALVADVAQDAIRWSAAMKQAEEQQLADLHALNLYISDVYATWTDRYGDDSGLPADWSVSAERWYASGLRVVEVQYGIDVSHAAGHVRRWDKWKYACGVIYKRLRDRQEMAQKLLAGTSDADEQLDVVEADSDELHELQADRNARAKWLVLAAQWPELAKLEGEVREVCYAVWNEGSEFEPHEVWEGTPAFQERFGSGVAAQVAAVKDHPWFSDTDRRVTSDYIARLVTTTLTALDDPWANPFFASVSP